MGLPEDVWGLAPPEEVVGLVMTVACKAGGVEVEEECGGVVGGCGVEGWRGGKDEARREDESEKEERGGRRSECECECECECG